MATRAFWGSTSPPYDPPHYTYEQEVMLEACNTALDWYVTDQTRSYAISRGRVNKLASLTEEKIW